MLRPSYKDLLLLGSPVLGQINFGTPGSQGNRAYSGSKICNKTTAAANSARLFPTRHILIATDVPRLDSSLSSRTSA
jgi:hypothetical protein